jgi:putative hydrolase of the HAD superfamily
LLSPNGITTILFDLDGTLRYNLPSSTQVFLDYAVTLGLEDSPEKRLDAMRWTHYYWANLSELQQDEKTYGRNEAVFWANYARLHLEAFGASAELAAELAPLMHEYMKNEHKPVEYVPADVPVMLHTLKEAGFRLGVLSNRVDPCQSVLELLGLTRYFDLALVAGEVACWKPDPEIFFHALKRLGTAPEQAVYVGDNYYADIVGAQRAGLRPVLIDPDGVFPDADCTIIRTMGELGQALESTIH